MASTNSRFSKPGRNMKSWLASVAAKRTRTRRAKVTIISNAPRLPVKD